MQGACHPVFVYICLHKDVQCVLFCLLDDTLYTEIPGDGAREDLLVDQKTEVG